MESPNKTARKTAYLGLFLALALICSYVESLIPFSFGIPGVKLGLTNIVVVLLLYCMGAKEAFFVSMVRIFLNGILFGNLFSMVYSFAGGLLSFGIMVLLKKKTKLKCISVSTAGGIFHNIGQLLAAAVIVENLSVLFYIPVLLGAGTVTGLLIGVVAQELILRLGKEV
jgi:heptaprenyl diphosphate synthase